MTARPSVRASFRRPVAWRVVLVNGVSTLAGGRQMVDPRGRLGLGPGGLHLFPASLVVMAASVALVLHAHDDALALDVWRARRRHCVATRSPT